MARAASRRCGLLVAAGVIGLAALPVPAAAAPPAPPACSAPSDVRRTELPRAQAALAFERAWNLTRGRGVTVAVVDTGIDAGVPQLRGRVAAGPDLLPGAQATDSDCAGHGTFLAGLVAAAASTGTAFVGVAPDAQLLAVRQRDGRERGATAPYGPALRAAVDAGADVVLMGTPLPYGVPDVGAAVAYAAERDALVVTPGFTLPEGARPASTLPATLVSVASSGVVPESARAVVGPFELVAPGNDIVSVSRRTGGQVQGSGVEMAAAFVAGTAALVRSYRPELSAAQVKQRLLATAVRPADVVTDAPALILDPLGAVATVLPAADPGPAVAVDPPPVELDLSTPVDVPRTRATAFVGIALALAAAGGLLAAVLGGRRRRLSR